MFKYVFKLYMLNGFFFAGIPFAIQFILIKHFGNYSFLLLFYFIQFYFLNLRQLLIVPSILVKITKSEINKILIQSSIITIIGYNIWFLIGRFLIFVLYELNMKDEIRIFLVFNSALILLQSLGTKLIFSDLSLSIHHMLLIKIIKLLFFNFILSIIIIASQIILYLSSDTFIISVIMVISTLIWYFNINKTSVLPIINKE